MLFFMTALLPPTEIQTRDPKMNQVGLPTCCSWNSAQIMEELSTLLIIPFSRKTQSIFNQSSLNSKVSNQTRSITKQDVTTSGSTLKEILYRSVNKNGSRKYTLAFLSFVSLKPGHGTHTYRQVESTLTLASNRYTNAPRQRRVAWLKPKNLLATPKHALGCGLYKANLRNVIHLQNAPGKQQCYTHRGKGLPGDFHGSAT